MKVVGAIPARQTPNPAVRGPPTARDSLKFFCELQDQRSALLEFRASGRDKWQVIHAWLLSEGRVAD